MMQHTGIRPMGERIFLKISKTTCGINSLLDTVLTFIDFKLRSVHETDIGFGLPGWVCLLLLYMKVRLNILSLRMGKMGVMFENEKVIKFNPDEFMLKAM